MFHLLGGARGKVVLTLATRFRRNRLPRREFGIGSAKVPTTALDERSSSHDLLQERHLRYMRVGKRALDIAVALVGLSVFAVLLPLLAVAIKLDSPGPVFFSQVRIGIDRRRRRRSDCPVHGERRRVVYPGRPFRLYKLRTMRVDAEAAGPRWATPRDDRVTRVGRWLRRTRLDEFPQFWNVLKGEMSVIGPRPERLCFIRQLEQQVPHYHDRLVVLPGITGLAQVLNGYDTDVESVRRKVALDRHYIQRMGWREDLRILLLTLRTVVAGRGAH